MRLRKFQETLGRDELAVVTSDADLGYLAGLRDEDVALMITRDRAVLFGESSARRGLWEDEENLEEKASRAGVAEVASRTELEAYLKKDGRTPLSDLRARVGRLRNIKDESEIQAMRKAAQITAHGHREVMRRARAGLSETEIAAIFLEAIASKGAIETAYSSIVGSGRRSLVLHARAGERVLAAGELVLVDAAAKWKRYCADVTRTWPVDSQFTPEQRRIYDVVLSAQKTAIHAVAPGRTLASVHDLAKETLIAGLESLGLREAREKMGEWFPHGTGHWLGLEVHDPAPRREADGSDVVLAAGMVLTVEPGLYFRGEADPAAYRGLGVRIEDDVLVTADGCEVLSAGLEKEVEEIEYLRSRGR